MHEEIVSKALEIAYKHNYKEEVDEAVKYLRNELSKKEPGYIMYLDFGFEDSNFGGSSEEGIAKKISEKIIKYKIKEKAIIQLALQGIIYPISIREDNYGQSISYCYKQSSCSTVTINTTLSFPKYIFNAFMKV